MSKKPVNHIITLISKPILKNLVNVNSTQFKRWTAVVAVHLFYVFLIMGSVSSNYLLFDEIMASAIVVLALMFFAAEDYFS